MNLQLNAQHQEIAIGGVLLYDQVGILMIPGISSGQVKMAVEQVAQAQLTPGDRRVGQ